MSAIAVPRTREAGTREHAQSLAALLHSPAVAAALLSGVIAVVVAVVGPTVARTFQDREKTLEVRTTLATDMSKSFTIAVGAGQRVASGLIYGPTGDRKRNAALAQASYNAGLGQWQIDGGRIKAELSARYPGDGIVHEWALYRQAVTRYYRLSAVLPPKTRPDVVARVRGYFRHMRSAPWAKKYVPKDKDVNWNALRQNKKFSRSVVYRQTYDQLSSVYFALGDAFVERMLKLQPKV
jgi:hypothetical protein